MQVRVLGEVEVVGECRSRSAGRISGGCWRHWRSAGARSCPFLAGRGGLAGRHRTGTGRAQLRTYVHRLRIALGATASGSRPSVRDIDFDSTSTSSTPRSSSGWLTCRPRPTTATGRSARPHRRRRSDCGWASAGGFEDETWAVPTVVRLREAARQFAGASGGGVDRSGPSDRGDRGARRALARRTAAGTAAGAADARPVRGRPASRGAARVPGVPHLPLGRDRRRAVERTGRARSVDRCWAICRPRPAAPSGRCLRTARADGRRRIRDRPSRDAVVVGTRGRCQDHPRRVRQRARIHPPLRGRGADRRGIEHAQHRAALRLLAGARPGAARDALDEWGFVGKAPRWTVVAATTHWRSSIRSRPRSMPPTVKVSYTATSSRRTSSSMPPAVPTSATSASPSMRTEHFRPERLRPLLADLRFTRTVVVRTGRSRGRRVTHWRWWRRCC